MNINVRAGLAVLAALAAQIFTLSSEAALITADVSFTARGFQDEIARFAPPAESIAGAFEFTFDDGGSAGGFSVTPTKVNLNIDQKDFASKVLTVGVQWDGSAFEHIRLWAGTLAFPEGDDVFLELFPQGGGILWANIDWTPCRRGYKKLAH